MQKLVEGVEGQVKNAEKFPQNRFFFYVFLNSMHFPYFGPKIRKFFLSLKECDTWQIL